MEQLYKKIIFGTAILLVFSIEINAQGCIAIRSGCGVNIGGGSLSPKGSWQVGTNLRYFHSYKHFRGKHEETHRVQEGTEVINDSYFLDLSLLYALSDRLSVNMVIPFVYHERSSMYEHGGNPPNGLGDRHKTYAQGLGDVRVGVNYWMLDPEQNTTNFSLGMALKVPSGNYKATSTFYNQGDNRDQTIESGVDQSIQPGDGGYGLAIESQGFHVLSESFLLSVNLYYLINPREQYSIENRGRTRYYSVADQYAGRLGVFYMTKLHGFGLYGGMRFEGIPSSDLFGGDEGFRRPGYIVSMEPGVSYNVNNFSLNVTVPVAIERARTQNFDDKIDGDNGDAAFADYLLNFGLTWRFGGKSVHHQMEEFNQVAEPGH